MSLYQAPEVWRGNTKSVVADALPMAAHCACANIVATIAHAAKPEVAMQRFTVGRGKQGTISPFTMGNRMKSPHIPPCSKKPMVTDPDLNVPSLQETYAARNI